MRKVILTAAALLVIFNINAVRAAENCSGKADVLGTSRVLTISPTDYARIGAIDHGAELPLSDKDKEVVITFDDGPLPRNTNQVLDILAAQCVKATFFMVGEMAHC